MAERRQAKGNASKKVSGKQYKSAQKEDLGRRSKPTQAKRDEVSKTRKNHKHDSLRTVASPHANHVSRLDSCCSVSHECGACQYIDTPYEEQLRVKDAQVTELYSHVVSPETMRPILGMQDPYFYRNKVMSPYAPGRKLSNAPGQNGFRSSKQSRVNRGNKNSAQREILCGMYAKGTHCIIPTDDCLIENKQAKQIIRAIRSLMLRFGLTPYDENRGTGFLRHVVVRVGHASEEILVTLVTNERDFPGSRSFCRELVKRCPAITTIVQNVNTRQTNVVLGQFEQTLYGPGFILDTLCDLSFRISSQSFYQVNAVQTEVLYRSAIELANLSGTERVIDAYCGTGTIGLVAAKYGAAQVIGVDSVESAIRDARQNARHNGVENAEFVVGDAGDFMIDLASEGHTVDVLLMDPPRAGSSEEFLRAAVKLAPKRIVYVSCNPQTGVRDVEFLVANRYAVTALQPVDMFPHTDHIETITALSLIP